MAPSFAATGLLWRPSTACATSPTRSMVGRPRRCAVGRMTRSTADMPLAALVTGPVTAEGPGFRTPAGAAPDRGLPQPSPAGQARVLVLDQPGTQRSGI